MKSYQIKYLWQLIKAEFSYNSFLLVYLYGFMSLTFWGTSGMERSGIFVDPAFPQLITVAILAMLFTSRYIEKRIRYHHIFPIKTTYTSIAKVSFQILFWAGALLIYSLSYSVSVPESIRGKIIWRIFNLSSLLISANAIYSISIDLLSFTSNKRIFVNVLIIIVLWFYILASALLYPESSLFKTIQNYSAISILKFLYTTPVGVLLNHLLALIITYMGVLVFSLPF